MKFGWSNPQTCSIRQPIGDDGTITTNGSPVGSSQVYCLDQGASDYLYTSGYSVVNVSVPASNLAMFDFEGGPWRADIPSLNGGNWKFQTVAQTPKRPDTGQVNKSPIGAYIPEIILSKNCPLNDGKPWLLPVYDPDQDYVNCRFGTADECGAVCAAQESVITSGFTQFNLVGASGCALVAEPSKAGLYPFGFQYDDYAAFTEQPLSTVPIQFMVKVIDTGITDCTNRPDIIKPSLPHMACLGVLVISMNVSF